jgi:hypothetical protein
LAYKQSDQETGLEVPAKAIEAYDSVLRMGGGGNEPIQVFGNKFTGHNDLLGIISGFADGYSCSRRHDPREASQKCKYKEGGHKNRDRRLTRFAYHSQ